MFDDLKTIFNNDNDNDNDNKSVNDNDNNNDNENINDNESVNDNESINDNENENKNKNKNVNDYEGHKIRQINCCFETIVQTKSFEEQIEILKTKDFLDDYWHVKYYHDNKGSNYKIFKAKAAYVLNDVDDNLFEKIFSSKFATLVDKLTNTTSKEENQMFINDIKKKQKQNF